jgi:hypothetical protein
MHNQQSKAISVVQIKKTLTDLFPCATDLLKLWCLTIMPLSPSQVAENIEYIFETFALKKMQSCAHQLYHVDLYVVA